MGRVSLDSGNSNKQALAARFLKAVQFETEEKFEMALGEYASILKENPGHKESYLNLGSLYSRMNRYEEAMACYEKALLVQEDHVTYFNIGSIHYKRGEYKKAVLALEKSRNLNPSFPMSMLVMGLSFSRLKNLNAAKSCFLRVLKTSPSNRVAMTALAIIYYEKKDYERALKLVSTLLSGDESNAVMRKLRADVLYRLNRVDESAREFIDLSATKEEFRRYDDFVKEVPVDVYTDCYGSIGDKIIGLEAKGDAIQRDELISLSLCYLLKGDSGRAIESLFEARKRMVN